MSPSATLHVLRNTGLPVGLACNHCLHRALVERDAIGAHEDDVRHIESLRFLCTKCGRRDFSVHLFTERRLLRRFMAEYR